MTIWVLFVALLRRRQMLRGTLVLFPQDTRTHGLPGSATRASVLCVSLRFPLSPSTSLLFPFAVVQPSVRYYVCHLWMVTDLPAFVCR